MEAAKIEVGGVYALKTSKYSRERRVEVVAKGVKTSSRHYGAHDVCAEIAEAHGVQKVSALMFRGPNAVLVMDDAGRYEVYGPRHIARSWDEQEVVDKEKEEAQAERARYYQRKREMGKRFADEEGPAFVAAVVAAGISEPCKQFNGIAGAVGVAVASVYPDGSGDMKVTLSREVVIALTEALRAARIAA